MPSLHVIADVPQLLSKDGEAVTSRVQIAKKGEKFIDPRYGRFSITQAHFDTWMRNFQALSLDPDGSPRMAIDIDHSPEKQGKTEAAGWVLAMDQLGEDGKTETPDELWATVEWNDLGAELVRNKRYRFLSPSYQHNFVDEEGRQHGTHMVGVALTNRPFLRMAAVSLSRSTVEAEIDGPEGRQVVTLAAAVGSDDPPASGSSDSPRRMSFLDDIRKALNLSADTPEDKVLEAARAAAATPPSAPSGAADGKTLSQLAAEQGSVVLSLAEHGKLVADAAAGAEAAKQLHKQRFEDAWSKALDDGQGNARVVPAQREHYEAFYEANPEKCLDALAKAPVILSGIGTAIGDSGDTSGVSPDVRREAGEEGLQLDADRAALDTKARQLAAQHNIDYGAALDMAVAELGVA